MRWEGTGAFMFRRGEAGIEVPMSRMREGNTEVLRGLTYRHDARLVVSLMRVVVNAKQYSVAATAVAVARKQACRAARRPSLRLPR